MTLVAASLWSVPSCERTAVARRLASAGLRRWHWDVSDGRFAAPGGFTVTEAVEIMNLTSLPGDAHLMVTDALAHLEPWVSCCEAIAVHVESEGWREAIERIQERGRTASVAIAPSTDLAAVDDLPANVGVLVMAVEPGRAGSAFDEATPARVAALRTHRPLGVDGSIDPNRGRACVAAGASWLVSGTSLTTAEDPREWLEGMG